FWRFTEDGMRDAYFEDSEGVLRCAFGAIDIDYVCEHLERQPSEEAGWEWIRQFFEGRGFDGIKYRNVGETENHEACDYSYIVFRPHQIINALALTASPEAGYEERGPELA